MTPIFRAAMRPILAFLWGYLGLHVVFGLANTGRSDWGPGIWLAAIAGPCLWIAVVRMTGASLPWANAAAVASVLVGAAVNVFALGPQELNSYANWWPGHASVLASLLVVYGKRRQAAGALAVAAAAAFGFGALRHGGFAMGFGYALSSVATPVVWTAAVAWTLSLLGHISDRQLGLASLTMQQDLEAELSREAAERQRRDVEVMRSESAVHLAEIAGLRHGAEITLAQRRRWDLGALTLRDELASRALLDDTLRRAVRLARRRGAAVELQDGLPEQGEVPLSARRVMASAVRRLTAEDSLSLRRQPGVGQLSVAFLGPSAGAWLDSLGSLPDGTAVLRDDGVAHLTFEQGLFEQAKAPAEAPQNRVREDGQAR